MKRRPAKPATYVRVAQRLARRAGARPISSAEVAWHAHRRVAGNLDNRDLDAERALSDSGLFERANFINSNQFGIQLWRVRTEHRWMRVHFGTGHADFLIDNASSDMEAASIARDRARQAGLAQIRRVRRLFPEDMGGHV
jgi:hypothetical protein